MPDVQESKADYAEAVRIMSGGLGRFELELATSFRDASLLDMSPW